MKKVFILILILLILTGCKNKQEKENIKQNILLTCDETNATYYFYYENETDSYYKAVYTINYQFKTEKEANDYEQILLDNWKNKYSESIMEIETAVFDTTTYVTITAFKYTDESKYKDYFKDRYNLNMNDMNKSFNNKCLIKPIKK